MRVAQSSVAAALLLCAAAANAAVTVKFIKPDEFTDIGRFASVRDSDDALKNVETALTERAQKVLAPGQDMAIDVLDIDLAGEVRPVGRQMEMVRVVKPLYRPAMKFHYVITQGGKELRSGTANLSDMSFMDRFNRYFADEPLRWEKPMLDDWFKKEFAPATEAQK